MDPILAFVYFYLFLIFIFIFILFYLFFFFFFWGGGCLFVCLCFSGLYSSLLRYIYQFNLPLPFAFNFPFFSLEPSSKSCVKHVHCHFPEWWMGLVSLNMSRTKSLFGMQFGQILINAMSDQFAWLLRMSHKYSLRTLHYCWCSWTFQCKYRLHSFDQYINRLDYHKELDKEANLLSPTSPK